MTRSRATIALSYSSTHDVFPGRTDEMLAYMQAFRERGVQPVVTMPCEPDGTPMSPSESPWLVHGAGPGRIPDQYYTPEEAKRRVNAVRTAIGLVVINSGVITADERQYPFALSNLSRGDLLVASGADVPVYLTSLTLPPRAPVGLDPHFRDEYLRAFGCEPMGEDLRHPSLAGAVAAVANTVDRIINHIGNRSVTQAANPVA